MYTEPPTVVDLDELTPAWWNIYVKDNFNADCIEQAIAKGDLFPASGNKSMARLAIGSNMQIVEVDSSTANGFKNSWGFIPVGGIILWAGSLGSLPSNWHLCDGTTGTPDLRDRFVISANDATYTLLATGGAATANLQHNHTVTSAPDAGHSHTQGVTGAGTSHYHSKISAGPSSEVAITTVNNLYAAGTGHTHEVPSETEAAHTHTNPDVSSATHTHTTTLDNQLSASQDMRPPYYALAYIMRIS